MARFLVASAALAAVLAVSFAHMGVSPSITTPGGRETYGITISHDCGTDTVGTSNFTIVIPDGFVSVTVEYDTEWHTVIHEKVLDPPVVIGSSTYNTSVAAVEFHGFLPDGYYKTFGIKARAPSAEVGTQFWWMGYQECHGDGTDIAWATIPSDEDPNPRRPARATTIVSEDELDCSCCS